MATPRLMIRHKIHLGFSLVFVMALLLIFAVVELLVKPKLTQQQQQQIALNQAGIVELLGAKLSQTEFLTSTLAITATRLPKEQALFKALFPRLIDNHGDATIAGGGIWPEPGTFAEGVTRRSFFWGRANGAMRFVDDYNDPDGAGYHNRVWYLAGRDAPADRCQWSNAYTDPFTLTPMVTCTIPMYDDRFVGVATVDMRLDGITDILSQYGAENEGYAFAIDNAGRMISFPPTVIQSDDRATSLMTTTAVGQQLPWLKATFERATVLQDTDMIELPNDDILGEAAYVHLISVPQTGWAIGLVVPKSRMTAAAKSTGLFLMLAIGALLSAVGTVAAISLRKLLQKIQQTTGQVQELAEGESTRVLDTGPLNEIGELRLAVNAYGDKLKSLLKHLEEVQDELVQSEKLASLGSLVSGIAHELNTPVGNALMSSTAILDAKQDFTRKLAGQLTRSDMEHFIEDVDEGAQIIERNMTRAAELIGAFKQLAVDQASSNRRVFELQELVNEVHLSMRPTLQRTPCRLEIDVPASLSLDSYPGSLSQVLINLINNAVIHAFNEDEPGTIRITARAAAPGWLSLSVSDDGCGIPKELQKRIFDPFYTTRLGQGGSGLGLHITFNLVTGMLGGRIDISSPPGSGSCFTVTLPVNAPNRDES